MSTYVPVVLWCMFVSQQLQVDGLRSSLHTPVLKRQHEHNQLPNLERVFTCLKPPTAAPQQFSGRHCMFSCTALLRAKLSSYFPDEILYGNIYKANKCNVLRSNQCSSDFLVNPNNKAVAAPCLNAGVSFSAVPSKSDFPSYRLRG